MQIAGLIKNSVVDYPGKIAAVIFTSGCNLDCYYCHNRFLLSPKTWGDLLSEEEVLRFLEKRKKLLDGVVISGGEPTLQKDLKEFLRKVKNLDYEIKLDTNGTNPALLKDLIDNKLLDYVAMDFKAPFQKYSQICGSNASLVLEEIKESIKILLTGQVAYEFRTTFNPELKKEDILEMAEYIQGARLYVLQQYRKPDLPDYEKLALRLQQDVYSTDFIKETVQKVSEIVAVCETRGI
ncbi:MAG: anaerobic ribonucleoside-triphosphate reductase activating protein [Clostridia bacterium]|jgi:pyruvate formate lyase activating enzyme|nr:anaerobic ribonucleoside-triphosphate reductase activating protein [Clostridia bacterium]